MHSSKSYTLLHDTLRDAQYEAFRKKAFAAGLGVLRAKHRRTVWPQRLALAASIVLMLGLIAALLPHKKAQVPSEKGFVSFSTRPLAPNEIVTSSIDPNLAISTRDISGNFETVATIHLLPKELNNRELFAVLGNRPAGLVHLGNRTEFILLDN